MLLYYVIVFSILFYIHLKQLYQEGLPPLQRQTDVCPWRRNMPPGRPSRPPGADRGDGALLVWSYISFTVTGACHCHFNICFVCPFICSLICLCCAVCVECIRFACFFICLFNYLFVCLIACLLVCFFFCLFCFVVYLCWLVCLFVRLLLCFVLLFRYVC